MIGMGLGGISFRSIYILRTTTVRTSDFRFSIIYRTVPYTGRSQAGARAAQVYNISYCMSTTIHIPCI